MNDFIVDSIVENLVFFSSWNALHWVFSAKNRWHQMHR